MSPVGFILLVDLQVLLDDRIRRSFTMIEVSEWPIAVGVARIVTPLRLVRFIKLNIFFNYRIWACFAVVEMCKGAIVIRIS